MGLKGKIKLNNDSNKFPGLVLLYAIDHWEIYPINGVAGLNLKYLWLHDLGDYFVFDTTNASVPAIATRKQDGTLETELIGHKNKGFVAKDFPDLVRQIELNVKETPSE